MAPYLNADGNLKDEDEENPDSQSFRDPYQLRSPAVAADAWIKRQNEVAHVVWLEITPNEYEG